MFNIMFMRQKRYKATRLILITPHGPYITVQTAARRKLTRADPFTRSCEHLSSAVRSSQWARSTLSVAA